MFLTCTDLKYAQGTLPTVGEGIEDIVESLRKIFERAASEPLPGIEVCHDVI